MPKANKLTDPDPPNKLMDISDLPNSQGGSFMTGLLNAIRSGAMLPGDVATGRIDPYSDEGIARTQDLAGLAMTGGLAGAGEAGATVGSGPIRAYHGSPHDFDRFDLSKIGTGEGAQVYGHGLYFAESPATAEFYRDALTKNKIGFFDRYQVGEKPLGEALSDINPRVRSYLDQGFDRYSTDMRQGAIARADDYLAKNPDSPLASDFKKAKDVIAGAQDPTRGRMYEVAIHADPERFLDWDKPLAQQPHVLDALRANPRSLDDMKGPLRRKAEAIYGGGDLPDAADGYSAYMLAGGHQSPVAASQALKEAGIPGIKYLDQGSRTAGDGSRNYVTFSDKIVEIMRKYGVASFAALPPSVQMMLQHGTKPEGNKLTAASGS